MVGQIVIEHLEFQGHCGVTPEERAIPQPIAVDLELDYPPAMLESASASGEIAAAIDYGRVSARVVELGTARPFQLLETLAEHLMARLLEEFSATRIRLWVRKVKPPLPSIRGSVGIRAERASPARDETLPAPFLAEQVHQLPKGTVLDVAAGRGRNALFLASRGYTVDAVDHDPEALGVLGAEAERRHLSNVVARDIDLEARPELAKDRYDAIIVFFFLYRPLVPLLVHALKPGGVLMYETFLLDNHLRHHHPRRREFCLAHNELLHLAAGLRILHYDEGEHNTTGGPGPAFTARLLATKEPDHESD